VRNPRAHPHPHRERRNVGQPHLCASIDKLYRTSAYAYAYGQCFVLFVMSLSWVLEVQYDTRNVLSLLHRYSSDDDLLARIVAVDSLILCHLIITLPFPIYQR